ncbi:MAG: protein phosphatase 2C domain-containing protein [bacterium]|nr:protein phosphatase 2C domain-containing protein [bacterium]
MPFRNPAVTAPTSAAALGGRSGMRRAFGLDADACTHVGRRRQRNEDAFLLTDDLVAVADGLGGHAGGELASAIAVGSLHSSGAAADPESLRDAFAEAHLAVQRRAGEEPELAEMCTTMCALALEPAGSVVLANVGDSRIYRYSDGRMTQVTWDHNWENEYVRMGMSPASARRMQGAGSLSRVIGAFPEPCEADVWTFDAVHGDRYLLASDGLTRELPDPDIAALLAAGEAPGVAATRLVEEANDRGGNDNITVIVADVAALEPRRLL